MQKIWIHGLVTWPQAGLTASIKNTLKFSQVVDMTDGKPIVKV